MGVADGRLGRYRELELLGQGGMGVVYRARDPELDRPVAIKVMRDATPEFVARFRREAQAIARLVHPHVVQVYDFGVDDDFMRKVGEGLTPGGAAVFALVSDAVTEKVLPQLAPYGGQIIQTSLSSADEEHLREAVASLRAGAAHAS